MIEFWAGVALGFVANILASQCWEFWKRFQAHKAAAKFVGTWVAYDLKGRNVDTVPMKGAGLTEVSSRHPWWSPNAAVLDFFSQDVDANSGATRDHDGRIVIDPAIPWLATRIDRYRDSNEVAQQRLVIGRDFDTIFVFPVPAFSTLGDVYGKHAWRRKGTTSTS